MLLTHFIWQTVLKPLSVYEYQERSNHPFSHSYNAGKVLQGRQVGAGNMERYNQFIEASRSSLGVVLGDLVDVAAWGIVPSVYKICELRLIRWDFSTVYYKCFLRTSTRTHMSAHAHAR